MPFLLICLLPTIFYLLILLLYLQDKISGFTFIFILFFVLIFLVVTRFIKRKSQYKRKINLIFCITFLLFCYELPLILYDSTSHVALLYQPPEQIVEGSNIYLLGVSQANFEFMENKLTVAELLDKQHINALNIIEGTNQLRYESKNRQLLEWFHLKKDDEEQMKESVRYNLGIEDKRIDTFLNRNHIDGNSAGLGLVLSGIIIKGNLQNTLPIAVTGGIDKKGDVLPIGVLKEKIQIASLSGIPFMIVPSENAK